MWSYERSTGYLVKLKFQLVLCNFCKYAPLPCSLLQIGGVAKTRVRVTPRLRVGVRVGVGVRVRVTRKLLDRWGKIYHSPNNRVLIFLAKITLFLLAATNYSKGRWKCHRIYSLYLILRHAFINLSSREIRSYRGMSCMTTNNYELRLPSATFWIICSCEDKLNKVIFARNIKTLLLSEW